MIANNSFAVTLHIHLFAKSLLMAIGHNHLQPKFQKDTVQQISLNTKATVIKFWDWPRVRRGMIGILQKITAEMITNQNWPVFIQPEKQLKL